MSRFATCRRRSSYSFPACPESRKLSLNLRFGEKLLPRMVGDQLRARILKLSRDRDLVFDLDRDLLLEDDLIDLGGGDGDCDSAFLGIFKVKSNLNLNGLYQRVYQFFLKVVKCIHK